MTEEINEMINKFCDSVEKRIKQYDLESELQRLKQENEKLKGIDGNIHPDSAYYKIKKLEIENEALLKQKNSVMATNIKYFMALEEIQRVINLAYKVEDYQLGQDYTDLVDRIDKELEVLK